MVVSAASVSLTPFPIHPASYTNEPADFSKLGGGAGGGMPDFGGDDDEDGDDEDDSEMPGLESEEVEGKGKGIAKGDDAEESATAPKTGGAKIEEIP